MKIEEFLTSKVSDRVIRHTVVHHSSTSTDIPNFIGIGKTFFGQTDVRSDVRTDGHLRHLSPIYILLGRLFGVDLTILKNTPIALSNFAGHLRPQMRM